MGKKVLIVEDGFVEANNVRIILEKAGFRVTAIACSYDEALACVQDERPDLVLLDIFLTGKKTGIDLAHALNEQGIAFVYLSANSNSTTLSSAKQTQPYGFLVKPFREKDVLVTLDIALYLHEQKEKLRQRETFVATFPKSAVFTGIIGNAPSLEKVLQLVRIVAPTDTSVLILGESGTGKEGLADSIYRNSRRKSKPFIKVNCAALPPNLIESELFGHERGAFTGAADLRIGKFEQARGGTIFLDEIGEMPIDLQVKLLRVLQEKEIERVGGKGTIPLDIRVVAATNKDLEKEVAEGRFRMDLYYRLNVFPIQLPPLRERTADIPDLVTHFVQHFCTTHGLKAKSVADKAMKPLLSYPWPGNIRELENLMERTVLLNAETIIHQIPLPEKFVTLSGVSDSQTVKTIEEMEIEHIKAVLLRCKGKISGPGGAAELLELPYSTLISKIRKLGIRSEKHFK
jgi:DNA-binding NtrC family response regulator